MHAQLSITAVFALMVLNAQPAFAVDAVYDVAVAGVGVGKATLSVTPAGKTYTATLTGKYGFLFYSGSFSMASRGTLAKGKPTPKTYEQSVRGDEDSSVTISLKAGKVVDVVIVPTPKSPEEEGRVLVTEAHRTGVQDPLSAIVMQSFKAAQSGDAACSGSLPIFAGLSRINVTLVPAGERNGDVLCQAKFEPVSGYRPANKNMRRLAASDEIRIAFPATGDAAIRLPSFISVPLKIGTLTIELRR